MKRTTSSIVSLGMEVGAFGHDGITRRRLEEEQARKQARKEFLSNLIDVKSIMALFAGLAAVYLALGFVRFVAVSGGAQLQPFPFLDAPWRLIFSLLR